MHFFDDFSSGLDRSVWNVTVSGRPPNNEEQAYVDSPETIFIARGEEAQGAAGAALVIAARYREKFVTTEGTTRDFISGRIDTRGKLEFRYGKVAARLKLPSGPGLWPAFWALGARGPWPDTGEIDIMENVGEPDWVSVALHGPGYSADSALVAKRYFPPGEDAASWHVYAVEWTPESLLFTVDGTPVRDMRRETVERFGRWAYDNDKYLILNLALGGVYPVNTNGVRSPYLGIPSSTVALIREDKARMLVDWVQITTEKR